jgi:hypothetical protein
MQVVATVTSQLEKAKDSSEPISIVFLPLKSSAAKDLIRKEVERNDVILIQKVAFFASNATTPGLNQFYCFSSLSSCTTNSRSCSGHGTCVAAKANPNCFYCACKDGKIGDSCEFTDAVSVFHIVFFTSIVLLIVIVAVVYAILSIDITKDQWVYSAQSVRTKTE